MKQILLTLSAVLSLGLLSAQIDYDTYPEVTSTYFINDVHIQKSPQDSFGLGDILVEDGRISKVARSLTPPNDAYVVEGDSAYVYPAFIAALSHAGIAKKEKDGERPKVKFRGHPPNEVVGITPQNQAYMAVNPKDESLKKMRKAGFGVAHIVPRGSMLPGQGAIVLLQGDSKEEMVLQDKTALYMQLQGTRGFYPNTIIGVMAKWRELYGQASHLSQHQAVVQRSPFAKRAKRDLALEALIPLTKKEMPLIMKASKHKDIYRALALQQDLGYDLILAEVQQGWSMADRIKAAGHPILISAKLPKEAKDKDKDKKGKKGKKDKEDKKEMKDSKDKKEMKPSPNSVEGAVAKASDAVDRVLMGGRKSAEDKEMKKKEKKEKKQKEKKKDPETEALEKRKKEAMEAYVAQAATMEKAGVPFGFSFLDSKPEEVKKGLTRMMKAGLSQEAALASLTTNPARILGISDQVGTLDQGKLANFFISDAPYFDKESNIKMLFIEGKMNEFEVKKKKKAAEGEGSEDFKKNLVGKWDYTVETPGGNFSGMVIVTGSDELSITVTDDDEPDSPMEGRDISVGDNSLTFTMDIDMGMPVPATMELSYDGDSYSGTVSMDAMGSMPISGSKVSGPEHHHHDHNHDH